MSDERSQFPDIEDLLARGGLAERMLDLSSDAIAIASLEGRMLYVNDALCAQVGHSREELVGHLDEEFDFYLEPETRLALVMALREKGRYGPEVGRFRTRGAVSYADVTAEIVEYGGEQYVITVSRAMTEQVLALEELKSRDEILQAAAFAAQRFLEPDAFEVCMSEVLERIGRSTEVSRTYVYENSTIEGKGLVMSERYEWRSPGVTSTLNLPQNKEYPYLPIFERWKTTMGSGDVIQGPLSGFPESERRLLLVEDVVSLATVPVFVAGEWWGFIGLDDCQQERRWSQAEIDALKVVAGSIGAAIGQRRAEERLREAEITFRSLVEQLPGAVYLEGLAADKTTLYVSPRYHGMLGLRPQEGRPSKETWKKIVHPDDIDRVIGESEHTDATGEPYRMEYRVLPEGQPLMWVRDEAVLVKNDSGEALYWLGLITDITDRIHADEELRATEARLRALVEQIPVAVYTLVPGEDHFFLSPQMEKITGFPIETFQQMGFWTKSLHPDDRDAVVAEAERTDENGEDFDMEYRLIGADGREIWIHEVSVLVRVSEDDEGVWQGIFEDVTERKNAELQLRDAEERYRTLVERVPAVTYQERIQQGEYPQSTMVYMSPQAEEMLGYPREAYERDSAFFWERLIHPDDRDRVLEASSEAASGAESYEQEYRIVRANGTVGWVRDEAVRVRVEADGTQYWHGFLTDITKRKQAEEELERALRLEREAVEQLKSLDDMKNTFLNAVSHDLRTPLAAIHGLALTLEREDLELEPKESRDLAGRIAANSRKLERLVTDLLDLDRLSRGILEPQLASVDLGTLVRKVMDETDFAGDHPIQIEVEPVVVLADAAKVERIVENLVANSVRHTPVATRVWVRVWPQDDGAVIAIEDEGPGVLEELREAVFEPFRQGASPYAHSPGVGIGLSLVARFAELHGGRAWVEDRDGGGASFRVFLPGSAPSPLPP